VNNSQEVLRMVPGLFIGQHQGGGKAEQIFIRGFDCDHGTDINIMSDGMPVYMVSQAHAHGY
jgi:outer membrane receptor for Fe3+-dicitrate